MKNIWLDMDGTFVDLYGVNNWLKYLKLEKTYPYDIAKSLVDFNELEKALNKLKKQGYSINIISWTSKNSSLEYHEKVKKAKINYLKKYLNFKFDNIDIVPYGENKSKNRSGILFDDEKNNRKQWQGLALDEKNLIDKLNRIA